MRRRGSIDRLLDIVEGRSEMSGFMTWPAIIIMMIVFFPVGFFFMWKRIAYNYNDSMLSGKVLMTVGGIITTIAAVSFLGQLREGLTLRDIEITAVFGVPGILLLLAGFQRKALEDKYERYIGLIEGQGIDSIEKIAEIMRLPYEKVKMDLERMIKKNYLENAYIDEAAKRVVLPPSILDTLLGGFGEAKETVPQQVVVSCPGCGAKKIITAGTVDTCEYCKSAVHAK